VPVPLTVPPPTEEHKVPHKPLPKAGSFISTSSPTSVSTTPAPLSSSASEPTGPPPAKKLRRVKALWAFQGAQPGDLSFAAGDVITIVGEVEQWLEGLLNGVTGIFPSNYVTELND